MDKSDHNKSYTSLIRDHAAVIGDNVDDAHEMCARHAHAAGAFDSVDSFKRWFEQRWLDAPCALHFHAALGHEAWMNAAPAGATRAAAATPCALARTALGLLKATLLAAARTDRDRWRLWYQCPEMSYHAKAVAHLLQRATPGEKAALKARWASSQKMAIKEVLTMCTDVLGQARTREALRPPSVSETTALRRLDVEGLEMAVKTTLRSPEYWRKYFNLAPEEARAEFAAVYGVAWPENLEEAQDHALRQWRDTRAADALRLALQRRELQDAEKTYRLAQQVALRYLGLRMPPSPARPPRKKRRPAAPERPRTPPLSPPRRRGSPPTTQCCQTCGSPVRPSAASAAARAQA